MADKTTTRDRDAAEIEASTSPLTGPVALVDRLLGLLDIEARQDPGAPGRVFREQVADCRAGLRRSGGGPVFEELAQACLASCQEYLATGRALRAEQERGFRDVIAMLRESLTTLAADAGHFHADLASASERVSALMDVEDVRVLKQRLSEEVGTLKRVVEQRQRQDEITRSWLLKRVESLEDSLAATRKQAALDPLTRVANRGHFEQALPQWLAMSADAGRSFVMALVDVDHFKTINDTQGHPMGDRVLVGTAEILRQSVRPSDLVARYGGDEFALLLANMSLDQAQKRLPEIVARIAATVYPGEKGAEPIHVTISCGLTERARHDDATTLLARADEALYEAKRQGRNCAVVRRAPRWQGLLSLKSGGGKRRAGAVV